MTELWFNDRVFLLHKSIVRSIKSHDDSSQNLLRPVGALSYLASQPIKDIFGNESENSQLSSQSTDVSQSTHFFVPRPRRLKEKGSLWGKECERSRGTLRQIPISQWWSGALQSCNGYPPSFPSLFCSAAWLKSKLFYPYSCSRRIHIIESLSKPRRQQQRELQQTTGLMKRTMAVRVSDLLYDTGNLFCHLHRCCQETDSDISCYS